MVDNIFVINPNRRCRNNLTQNVAFMIKALFQLEKKAIQALIASPYWKVKLASKDEKGESEGAKPQPFLNVQRSTEKERQTKP